MGDQNTRFGLFLSAVLGRRKNGKPVSVQRLNAELNIIEGNDEGTDYRKTIYGYKDGAHVPYAPRARNIGVALRACGLDWCNGLIALYFADHYVDCIGTLSHIEFETLRKYRMLMGAIIGGLAGSWLMFSEDRLNYYSRISELYVRPDADKSWLERCGASIDEDAFEQLTHAIDNAWATWRKARSIADDKLFLLARVARENSVPNWQLQVHMQEQLSDWLRRRAYNDPDDFNF